MTCFEAVVIATFVAVLAWALLSDLSLSDFKSRPEDL